MRKYLQKLQDLYTGENFSDVSVRDIFESATAELVFQRPIPKAHSILEIVNHTISWRQFLIEKIQGNEEFEISQDSPLDWNRTTDDNILAWEETKSRFIKQQDQLVDLLSTLSETKLTEIVPRRKYDFTYLIEGIIEHDFYHFGQVKILMKTRV